MKNDLFLWGKVQPGKWMSIFCLHLFLTGVTSCSQGFESKEVFFGGVTGVILESPTLDLDNFATLVTSDGTEKVRVTWDVVYGASGYLFSVTIVDDPSNPIVVINDSIIDGCSVIFDRLEDTRYEISLKTLGNEKLNNKEAVFATVYGYSTLVPATTIPAGQDIATYINANLEFSRQEQGFELLGGATYTLDGMVDFDLNTITFRGDKLNRPTVVLGANGGLMTQGGLKIKYINFDCTNSTQASILSLSDNPSSNISTESLGYLSAGATLDGFVINDPIIIQECNFKNVKNSLLFGNKKPWSLCDFRIEDCIVQLNNDGEGSVIRLDDGGNGLIKNLTIKNNTFYNLVENSKAYFIHYSNASNAQPAKIFGDGDKEVIHTIEYNTFSHVMSNKDFGNNIHNTNTVTMNVRYNIFYNVFRLYQYLPINTIRSTIGNTIFGVWGGEPNDNDIGGRSDSNGNPYATLEDPNFVGPFEVEFDLTKADGGVNFTPRGPIAIENHSGDPRWYE